MKDFNFKKQARLEVRKAMLQGFIQGNEAQINFSKMALRGTFVLNGAAGIAIMYAKAFYLHASLTCFCIGAFASVVATCLSYLVQSFTTETWRYAFYVNEKKRREAFKKVDINAKYSKNFRWFCFIFVIVSLISFVIGCCFGINGIYNTFILAK